jgi:hypothetical protein
MPTTTDRDDFRTVTVGGAKLAAVTGAAVLVFALVSGALPAGGARGAVQALLVLALSPLVAFLPAHWVRPRSADGVAATAAIGLCGTVGFTVIDIALLRPLNHVVTIYPWTWDDVGGGSTWWYLPVWWMLGTLVSWLGGLLIAARASGEEPSLFRSAGAVAIGALALGLVIRFVWAAVPLPLAVGGGFTATLAALAVLALARGK